MTVWTNLFPAGSAAVGGLITGGFTIWAQIVTHHRAHTRERAARHDTFLIRRFEVEQETLLALQDAITDFHDADGHKYLEMHHGDLRDDIKFWGTYYKIMKLANRTLSSDVEEVVKKYAEFSVRIILRLDPREHDIPTSELSQEWEDVMATLRDAIRRDPFERRAPH